MTLLVSLWAGAGDPAPRPGAVVGVSCSLVGAVVARGPSRRHLVFVGGKVFGTVGTNADYLLVFAVWLPISLWAAWGMVAQRQSS